MSRGNDLWLKGTLSKPQGRGPFPAIVMLSGERGFFKPHDQWVDLFVQWGFVTLQLDLLRSRGLSSIYGDNNYNMILSPRDVAHDAYDAMIYLSGLPFVDETRVALIGWGFGGWATLYALDPSVYIQNRDRSFKSAIAFYPYCEQPKKGFNAPLLILHGELGDWYPASQCLKIEGKGSPNEISVKVYPGAPMSFDMPGLDQGEDGRRSPYQEAATADAIVLVKSFLEKYLK
ncbi:MAG: dienelactone hydrolase family protein [Deltaproteobacteria bacterium]|nr:dienelactone hydrolase family protein [Deltaproteobacteria bacterium]